MVTLTVTEVATVTATVSTTRHVFPATASVTENGHMKTEMGSVTCTKVLRWVRVFPTQLCAVDLPPTDRVSGNGDGVGVGYGRTRGEGYSYGPHNWEDYGDGWGYGTGKGGGVGSGYGGHNGNNN